MTKQTLTDSPTVVRLSGPQGLATAVPQLLGFQPSDSLVLLCLRAPRGRVGPVMRTDLFPPDDTDPVDQMVGCALRHADLAAVLCYYDGERPECLDVLLRALDAAGVSMMCALSVRDGMIRDASTDTAERADPGIPLPGPNDQQARQLAAASVMSGRQVLPSREALRASIDPPRGHRLGQARQAIDDACNRLAEDLTRRRVDAMRTALPDLMGTVFRRAVAEQGTSGAVARRTAADMIVLAQDITSRDLLLARAVGAGDPDVVPMLISVVAWCPQEDAPEICSVLAVAAYRFGDGALAQCAIDRVLDVQPDHRLAHLMLSVMAAGLPPKELAGMADIAGEPTDFDDIDGLDDLHDIDDPYDADDLGALDDLDRPYRLNGIDSPGALDGIDSPCALDDPNDPLDPDL